MAIILLRHTLPLVAPGTCYGQTDLDVAASFETDAQCALRSLPQISRIVTSPLKRCKNLADHIATQFDLSAETEPRLMEMNFGRWEGIAWNEIPRGELDDWAKDFFFARPHGGECVADLNARVDSVLSELRTDLANTLLVTHAGVIRAALATGEDASDFQTQIDFGEHIRLPKTEEER